MIFLTVCEICFKLKFSKFIPNIRTLESFGKFLLIVIINGKKNRSAGAPCFEASIPRKKRIIME